MDKQVRARPSKWTDLCAPRAKMDRIVRARPARGRGFPEKNSNFTPPPNTTKTHKGGGGVGRKAALPHPQRAPFGG
jgi:hypothetical protein